MVLNFAVSVSKCHVVVIFVNCSIYKNALGTCLSIPNSYY